MALSDFLRYMIFVYLFVFHIVCLLTCLFLYITFLLSLLRYLHKCLLVFCLVFCFCFFSRPKVKPTSSLMSKLQELYGAIRDYNDARGRTLSTPFMKLPSRSVSRRTEGATWRNNTNAHLVEQADCCCGRQWPLTYQNYTLVNWSAAHPDKAKKHSFDAGIEYIGVDLFIHSFIHSFWPFL